MRSITFLRTFPFIIFVLSAFLFSSGCATIFSDGEDEITFNSNVAGTKVYLDGVKLGVTPLTIDIDRKTANRKLKFTKAGYQDQEMELLHDFNMNFAMLLDITGTVLTITPGAIDALTGNIIKYTPTEYHIEMEPVKTGDRRLFHQRVASMHFAAHNFSNIQRDLVTGKGEFLDGLQASFQIPQSLQYSFKGILKKNLDALLTAEHGLALWYQLNQQIKDDPRLNSYHLG